jgi:hypothetical protein
MKKQVIKRNSRVGLFRDIKNLIEDSRGFVANTVNTTLVMLYWKVGARINADILKDKRAEYGKEVIASLAERLTAAYGKGWDVKTLRHCLRAAETFSEDDIVSAMRRQLGWTHIRRIYSKRLTGENMAF